MRAASFKFRPRYQYIGFLMILPVMGLYCVFTLYPIASSVVLSLHDWSGIGPKAYVGLDNYAEAFADPMVWLSFRNNLQYCLGLIAVGVAPGLILAALLAGERIRGRTVFQTIYFLPRLLSMVVVSIVWGWIYNPSFGLLNSIIRWLGAKDFSIGWLGNASFAMWAVVVAGGWTYFGFCMVIFIAALQNTDPSLSEAALIDGANWLQRFFSVIIPQISNVITMVLILTLIDAFKIFDIIYLMTLGGPGRKTEIMATYLYREAFRHNHFGYGSSIAMILTAFVLLVSIVFQYSREKRES